MNGFNAVIPAKAGIQWPKSLRAFLIRSSFALIDSGFHRSEEVGISYAIALAFRLSPYRFWQLGDTSPLPPPFTYPYHVNHANKRAKSNPTPPREPSQCPRPNVTRPTTPPPNPLKCPPKPRKSPPKPPNSPPFTPHQPPTALLKLAEMTGNEWGFPKNRLLPDSDAVGIAALTVPINNRKAPGQTHAMVSRVPPVLGLPAIPFSFIQSLCRTTC